MTSILEVFMQDHKILDEMFIEYARAVQTKRNNTTNLFNDLKNALEKHMKQEEELYQLFQTKSNELDDVIQSVRTQHENLIQKLHDVSDYEAEEEEQDYEHYVNEFINAIQIHEKFEEQYLYTKLDEILTDEEKEEFIYELHMQVKNTR